MHTASERAFQASPWCGPGIEDPADPQACSASTRVGRVTGRTGPMAVCRVGWDTLQVASSVVLPPASSLGPDALLHLNAAAFVRLDPFAEKLLPPDELARLDDAFRARVNASPRVAHARTLHPDLPGAKARCRSCAPQRTRTARTAGRPGSSASPSSPRPTRCCGRRTSRCSASMAPAAARASSSFGHSSRTRTAMTRPSSGASPPRRWPA